MITLTLDELMKVKNIAEKLGVENFTLSKGNSNGIGATLTLSYLTIVEDYQARVSIDVTDYSNW